MFSALSSMVPSPFMAYPDIDHSQHRQALDCQHLPVSHKAFDKMCAFGGNKLRASVILYAREEASSEVPTPASAPAR